MKFAIPFMERSEPGEDVAPMPTLPVTLARYVVLVEVNCVVDALPKNCRSEVVALCPAAGWLNAS